MKIRRARKSRWSLRFLGLIIITYTKTFNACSSAKNLSNSSETLSDVPLTHLAPMCRVYTPWKCKKKLCFILKSFQNNKWSQANGFFHNILIALILNISITVLNSVFFEGMFIDPKIYIFLEIYCFGVTEKLGSTRLWIFRT